MTFSDPINLMADLPKCFAGTSVYEFECIFDKKNNANSVFLTSGYINGNTIKGQFSLTVSASIGMPPPC